MYDSKRDLFDVLDEVKMHLRSHVRKGELLNSNQPENSEMKYLNKKYSCLKCMKAFVTKIDLDLHMRSVHKCLLNPFICFICQKHFSKKGLLIEHICTHTGEKSFKCSQCNYIVATKSNLSMHERRVHLREKRFTCECGKKFFDCNTWKLHQKIHLGVKDYACHLCNKKFVLQSTVS